MLASIPNKPRALFQPSEQIEQGLVDIVVGVTVLLLDQHAVLGQLVQVAGGRRPAHLQFLLHESDAGVGVAKQAVEQVLAVELVRAQPQPLLRLLHQGAQFRN